MARTDAVIVIGGGVGRGVGASVGRGVDTTGCGVGVGAGVGDVVGDGVGLAAAWAVPEVDTDGGADWLVDCWLQAVSKPATTIANTCRSMSASVENSVAG
jgi:hypothetical protein